MQFNSVDFIFYLIAVVLVYYLIPSNKWRKMFLLFSSYYFYACWNITFLALLLFVTILAYVAGLMMEGKGKAMRKHVLLITIILILAPLFCFKYLNFFLDIVHDSLGAIGVMMQVPKFEILLPIGISFYTFMSLGYVADIYLKKIQAEHDVLDFFLFIGFFPQIASGPIGNVHSCLTT